MIDPLDCTGKRPSTFKNLAHNNSRFQVTSTHSLDCVLLRGHLLPPPPLQLSDNFIRFGAAAAATSLLPLTYRLIIFFLWINSEPASPRAEGESGSTAATLPGNRSGLSNIRSNNFNLSPGYKSCFSLPPRLCRSHLHISQCSGRRRQAARVRAHAILTLLPNSRPVCVDALPRRKGACGARAYSSCHPHCWKKSQ